MPNLFSYKSYSWSLGTTSFRMSDFHRQVEMQLMLLDDFWKVTENSKELWSRNEPLQIRYYQYMHQRHFVEGQIDNEPRKQAKTARQKTSGLVDIGLINDERRLTNVGVALLKLARNNDFKSNNPFTIPKDSYLYFKQLLKTCIYPEGNVVRPYLVVGKVLSKSNWYLTEEEFTYLLPLCVSEDITNKIINDITLLRLRKKSIDDIISEVVLTRYNYPAALNYFLTSPKTKDVVMQIGMNRDGIRHDAKYYDLYKYLVDVLFMHDNAKFDELVIAVKTIKNKPGTLWRKLLFSNPMRIRNISDLKVNDLTRATTRKQFDTAFFKYLHIIKITATLSDYQDLNRRYLNITDTMNFSHSKVTFTPLFENFFKTSSGVLFEDAHKECSLLQDNCNLNEIHPSLVFNDQEVINEYNKDHHLRLSSIQEVYTHVEDMKYQRFKELIDTKFTNEVILDMLDKFENRTPASDKELIKYVSEEADVPTIFEYIIGVAWYRLSYYKGKILDYMKLSLDGDFLPRTHAGGGESDIIYEYPETAAFPKHTLLIECTLMQGTTQRRGEMEPVSRHLADYMINEDANSYCTFVSNNLHPSVISDFRGRKFIPYYTDDENHVDSMKILMLHTQDLKRIIQKDIAYPELYKIFDAAYKDSSIVAPPAWYATLIRDSIQNYNPGQLKGYPEFAQPILKVAEGPHN